MDLELNVLSVIMKSEYYNSDKHFLEALEWLQENAKNKWERFGGFFVFSNKDDAIRFKLTWG